MLLTRASLQGERHIRTDSEEMEKDISQKQTQQENEGWAIFRLENIEFIQGHNERQRRVLYYDKGIGSRRWYYTHYHIHTQYRNT